MEDKKKKLEHLNGHKLITRRHFLAQGLISGAAYVFTPSILSLLAKSAHAQDCGAAAGMLAGKTPVIIIDLGGGANFAGSNVMVGGAGGQKDFLDTYQTLGLTSNLHPDNAGQLNEEMGLAFHADSGILRGIKSVASPNTLAGVDGGIFCAVSDDDTGNNPHNPAYWLNLAGSQGELAQLVGNRNNVTGGNSTAPAASIDASRFPVNISSPNDAIGLVTAGKLSEIFPNQAKVQKVLDTVRKMSESRITAFSQQTLPNQIRELVKCGYIQASDFLNRYSANQLSPAQDPLITQVFTNLNDGNQRSAASITKLVLDGYAGVGTIEKGGNDYHTGNRSVGETRDFEAGQLIGRVLEVAARKNKDLVMYILTDGGVAANGGVDDSQAGRGKLSWTTENGDRSSTFMLVYKAGGGRVSIRNAGRQVGHFRANGSVETSSSLVGNSVTNLSKAIVANYLALHGQEGQLSSIIGDNPFGSDLNRYLIFNRLR
ncbi:MAG: hypothetical protein JNM93_12770 [Bacteriovoracaceae bacterium]|nr:hypothetical protein [Bacteriovoracaceae bacterium]